MKYVCEVCSWVYDEEVGDPEQGIAPGTKFDKKNSVIVLELQSADRVN